MNWFALIKEKMLLALDSETYREGTGIEVTLELGNFCPLACLHCSQDAGPFRSNNLTLKKAKTIVKEAKMMGADTLAISGGEPICSQLLIPICRFAKALRFRVYIYTAGSMIENHSLVPIADSLAHELEDIRIDRIIINLQAARPELHDRITGRCGSFANAVQTIKKLVALSLRVEIHFVPMKLNIDEIPQVVRLAGQLGVAQMNVIRFVPQGRGERNRKLLEPEMETYHKLSEVLTHIGARPTVPVRISEGFAFMHLKSTYRCMAARGKLTVSGDGTVCPCSAFKGVLKGNPAYNVNSRSLLEILETGIFGELRKSDTLSNQCGCTAQRLLNEKIMRPGPDPACISNRPQLAPMVLTPKEK